MGIAGNKCEGAAEGIVGNLNKGMAAIFLSCLALASAACNGPLEAPVSARSSTRQAVVLGSAASFQVLGASTVTNTGPTVISGDLGLSPGSAITGFPPGLVNGTTHHTDGIAAQGQIDANAAWVTLSNLPCQTTLSSAELGGLTLTPGVYCFTSPTAAITGALTLNFEGSPTATFVFKIASTLTTASGSSVVRINGGSDCNIFWQLGSSATLGTTSILKGTVIASASVTATTGASVFGRLLALNGAVTLDSNTINACTSSTPVDAGTGEIVLPDAGVAITPLDAEIVPCEDAGVVVVPVPVPDAGNPNTCGVIECCPSTPDCCGGSCVDLKNDDNNCGACGNECGQGECCHEGACSAI